MKQVYICFSTDIIHNGHLSILKKAADLGEVTVGILTDEVVASYKHYPLIPLMSASPCSRASNTSAAWWCRSRWTTPMC